MKVTFTVTCNGNAVTSKYQARTKITKFSDEKLHEAAPDTSGSATASRAEQPNPGGEKITVTVKGTDGEVTSEGKEIPSG